MGSKKRRVRQRRPKTVVSEVRKGLENLLQDEGVDSHIVQSMLTLSGFILSNQTPEEGVIPTEADKLEAKLREIASSEKRQKRQQVLQPDYPSVAQHLYQTKPGYFSSCTSEAQKQAKANKIIHDLVKHKKVRARKPIKSCKYYIKNDKERERIDSYLDQHYPADGEEIKREKKKQHGQENPRGIKYVKGYSGKLISLREILQETGLRNKSTLKKQTDMALLGSFIAVEDKDGDMSRSGYDGKKAKSFLKIYGIIHKR